MTKLTLTLLATALFTALPTFATPDFDSLTIRSTEINMGPTYSTSVTTIDPSSGVRTDSQMYNTDITGWEFKYSEQISDNTYWYSNYRNDRAVFTENTQIYTPAPVQIVYESEQTRMSTRQWSFGAGYILNLSPNTTLDFSGGLGRAKVKLHNYVTYDDEITNTNGSYLVKNHSYSTVAAYQVRLRHEFSEDLEFYTSIGNERWYADENETISVQTVGFHYDLFGDIALSFEFGKYDDEERTAIGAHLTF